MSPRFDLVGIVTADLTASLAFYRRLGLDIPDGAENEPHVETTLPGGVRLAWDPESTIAAFDPSGPRNPNGRIGLAFLCDDPAEVDRVHAELVAAGARSHLEPFDAFWGQRYATVFDPDGNTVDLFAPSSSGDADG